METVRGIGALVARFLIALIFILSGALKFAHPAMFAAMMTHAGVGEGIVMPLLYASAVIELVGGSLLVLGYQARWVAAVMFLWLIPVTVIMHAIPGGPINQIMVLKNLGIMGGLLMVAVQGPGGWSLDAMRTGV